MPSKIDLEHSQRKMDTALTLTQLKRTNSISLVNAHGTVLL